jgi:phage I-like protein
MSNNPILNRESGSLPPDNWYMVARHGEHAVAVRDAKGEQQIFLQVLDGKAIDAMVNRFSADRTTNPTLELLVDRDHFSDDTDQPSEAYGWIAALENRAGDLWAQIRWTDLGEPAVTNRRYRFLSPVWIQTDCEALGNRRIRPLRLDKAAVTNEPNIKGMVPLKNRKVPDEGRKESTMDSKTELLALLGLKADATDDAIVAACASHKTEIQNRTTELETIKNRVADLEKKELETLVEADLVKYAKRIANRDAMKALLIANRTDALKILEATAEPVEAQKILNRADTKTPETTAAVTAQNEARQKAVDEIKVKNRCSNARAWAMLPNLRPDLYDKK